MRLWAWVGGCDGDHVLLFRMVYDPVTHFLYLTIIVIESDLRQRS